MELSLGHGWDGSHQMDLQPLRGFSLLLDKVGIVNMRPGSVDEISIFLFLTCFCDEWWRLGPGQETNDTQMSPRDQNKYKLSYNHTTSAFLFSSLIYSGLNVDSSLVQI